MEGLIYQFPSGVRTYIFLPSAFMFFVSSFVSLGGLSGAFLLLPFQMSILGYTSPGVTATNFIYNIVSIPSGIYSHIKNRSLSLTIFSSIILGTFPGIFLGCYLRTVYLIDPTRFKKFAGVILGLLAVKVIKSIWEREEDEFSRIIGERFGLKAKIYLEKRTCEFSFPLLSIVSFFVGAVGTAYGIGGGAILSPFCVSFLRLPVYVVSGACLLSTWINSAIAVTLYSLLSKKTGVDSFPDLQLGLLFGIGGLFGIYIGSSIQKKVPERIIKVILGFVLVFISVKYLF